jgi:phosphate starvation-inducible membrane PsiE
MHIPKNYFHDRAVLLLLSTNIFLTLLCAVLVVLNIDFGRPDGYIVQYRANLGLSAYKAGSSVVILSFIGFAAIIAVLHTLLSIRMYAHRRNFAVAVLGMGLLLLVITLFVSNALLEI